jgi:hypothetical protein
MPNGKSVEARPAILDRPLNPNQIAFLERFLATFPRNATAAYLEVYRCKESTAAVQASRLLTDPRIVAEIEKRESPTRGRFKLSADRIRREIAAVQHSDMSHYRIAADGEVTLAEGAPADAMKAIQSIDRTIRRIPRGANLEPITEVRVRLRLWNKPTTLRLGTQVRGMIVRRFDPGGEAPPPPPVNEPTLVEVIFIDATPPK